MIGTIEAITRAQELSASRLPALFLTLQPALRLLTKRARRGSIASIRFDL